MAIETQCSGCGQRLAVPEMHAGKQARCPACSQVYTVPYPNAPTMPGGQDEPAQNAGLDSNTSYIAGSSTPFTNDSNAGLAETTAGTGSNVGSNAAEGAAFGAIEQFWMLTVDGNQYGPVDRPNLNRWFGEGRVGSGYQIKQGETGPWQPAEFFNPQPAAGPQGTSGSSNPYANAPVQPMQYASAPGMTGTGYQKGDPSALVLTMGILAWVCLLGCAPICWIPGLIAWISGRSALRDIQAGIADPSNVSLVQVGYYLGMVNVLLAILGIIGFTSIMAISIIAEM